MKRSLEGFLDNRAFLGFENEAVVGTAIIGMEKGHWLAQKMLDYYDEAGVVNGNLNMIPNSMIITDFLTEAGMKKEHPEYVKDVLVERRTVFYGSPNPNEFKEESVGIHYFRGSWWSEKERKRANNKLYVNVVRPALLKGKKIAVAIRGQSKARNIEVFIKNRRK